MSSRRWLLLALATVVALLVVGRWVSATYVDYLWYAAMGPAAARLWAAKAFNGALVVGASLIAGSLFAFANLYAVRRSIASLVLPRRVSNLEIGEEVPGARLTAAAGALSVLVGALLAFGPDDWTLAAFARYAQPFGDWDAVLERDFSEWLAWLPLERAMYAWALQALLFVAALVIFLYAVTTSLRWERGALHVTRHVRRHLTVLGALLIALLGWSYRLDMSDTLIAGSGPDLSFGWVDHIAVLPAARVLAVTCLLLAPLVAWAGWRGFNRVTFVAVSIVLVMSLVLRQALPPVARRVAVAPARQDSAYAEIRALSTVRAYGVDRVRLAARDTLGGLGFASLGDAAAGVPTWEPSLLTRAVERRRDLGDVANALAWEAAPAGIVASGLERGREDPADLARRPWTVVRALASSADAGGGPVLLGAAGGSGLRDVALPPPLAFDSARGYAIVPDTFGRVPSPSALTLRARLAHAWSEQNLRVLFADLPSPSPKLVVRRDVRARVEALAPFLVQGRTVTPLVAGDSLFWAVDLYSAFDTYPLSLHQEVDGREWSYFQHAAVALVQAQTGRVTLVPDSSADRATRVWIDRFPDLFTPPGALPPSLAALLPPPVEGAFAQARAVARFGLRDARWRAPRHLPTLDGADTAAASGGIAPLALPLPDGRRSTALTLPLLDGAERVHGVVVVPGGARGDAWWMPLGEPYAVWSKVLEQLQRSQPGSLAPRNLRELYGRVRVVPTRGGVLYAQPVFRYDAEGAPLLLRVAVAGTVGDSLRVGRTLAEALGVVPGPPPADAPPTTPAQLRARIEQLYDASRGALQRGDWAAFGRAYDELGALLGRGAAASGGAPRPPLPLEPRPLP